MYSWIMSPSLSWQRSNGYFQQAQVVLDENWTTKKTEIESYRNFPDANEQIDDVITLR
jgi:hypothetical protein